ncbi:TPA: hypothetical protein ACH3X2_010965 [Trebouxia sp. C0005]
MSDIAQQAAVRIIAIKLVRCTRTVCHVFIWKILLQSLEATLGDLSALYAATCISSLCRVCADAATAKGIVIQPAIDADIVPERIVDVAGQQRDHGQPQGPPQGKSKRCKKVQAKTKVTHLTKIPRTG